jgi:arylsulfatase A-like enzyme
MMIMLPTPRHRDHAVISMVVAVVAVVAVCASLADVASAASSQPPNILFVLADDTGWGDVGFNKDYLQPGAGGKSFTPNPPRTPNLDAWATGPGSILFDRFYSGNPVCSPTRSALLSGRTPFRDCILGANEQQPFPAVTPTVAQQAKKAGMRTLFIGKWRPTLPSYSRIHCDPCVIRNFSVLLL